LASAISIDFNYLSRIEVIKKTKMDDIWLQLPKVTVKYQSARNRVNSVIRNGCCYRVLGC
jgi:hypothetical protein